MLHMIHIPKKRLYKTELNSKIQSMTILKLIIAYYVQFKPYLNKGTPKSKRGEGYKKKVEWVKKGKKEGEKGKLK